MSLFFTVSFVIGPLQMTASSSPRGITDIPAHASKRWRFLSDTHPLYLFHYLLMPTKRWHTCYLASDDSYTPIKYLKPCPVLSSFHPFFLRSRHRCLLPEFDGVDMAEQSPAQLEDSYSMNRIFGRDHLCDYCC